MIIYIYIYIYDRISLGKFASLGEGKFLKSKPVAEVQYIQSHSDNSNTNTNAKISLLWS